MGYFTELNTLLGLAKTGLDPKTLEVGKTYTVTKANERVFPLHIAILIIGDNWQFYGYAVVHEALIKDKKTTLTFEVLSLFTPEEQAIYTKRFRAAGQKTGEV